MQSLDRHISRFRRSVLLTGAAIVAYVLTVGPVLAREQLPKAFGPNGLDWRKPDFENILQQNIRQFFHGAKSQYLFSPHPRSPNQPADERPIADQVLEAMAVPWPAERLPNGFVLIPASGFHAGHNMSIVITNGETPSIIAIGIFHQVFRYQTKLRPKALNINVLTLFYPASAAPDGQLNTIIANGLRLALANNEVDLPEYYRTKNFIMQIRKVDVD